MNRDSAPHLTLLGITLTLLLTACEPITLAPRNDLEEDRVISSETQQHYRMGMRYTSGTEVTQDYARAARLFEQAAQEGHTDAQYMYGIALSAGQGIGQNHKEAVVWLERAALRGHKRAQYQLGQTFMNGRGVARDRSWGARWYGMSAHQGYAKAQLALGVAFIKGIGMPKDPQSGAGWLMLAEKGGDATAGKLLKKLQPSMSEADYGEAMTRAETWVEKAMRGYDNRPTLRYLQFNLAKLGYQPGYADGILGPNTKAAVSRFLENGNHSYDLTLREVVYLMRERSPRL